MIYPFIIERSDKCNACGKDRSLEIYNAYDSPLHLSESIDSNTADNIVKMNARYFQCKNCGSQFPISWIENVPIPLEYSTYELFMNGFKKYKKE